MPNTQAETEPVMPSSEQAMSWPEKILWMFLGAVLCTCLAALVFAGWPLFVYAAGMGM